MKKKGSTLIEIVITIVLVAIIGSLASIFIVKGLDIWSFYKDQNKAQSEATLTVKKIVSELHKMDALSNISIANSQEFRFSVLGGNNVVGFKIAPDDPNQLIFYDKNAFYSHAYSGIYEAENTITDVSGDKYLSFKLARVTDFSLSYYGLSPETGALDEITNNADFKDPNFFPGPVRLIKIFLTVEEAGRTFTLGTVVRLRAPAVP